MTLVIERPSTRSRRQWRSESSRLVVLTRCKKDIHRLMSVFSAEREREKEREREYVCVCVRERERERVCVCERESVCGCVDVREKERCVWV